VFSLQAKDGKSVAIIDLLGLLVDCIEGTAHIVHGYAQMSMSWRNKGRMNELECEGVETPLMPAACPRERHVSSYLGEGQRLEDATRLPGGTLRLQLRSE